MRAMKILTGKFALLALSGIVVIFVTGCMIVPYDYDRHEHRGYHGDHDHHRDRDRDRYHHYR
jgi:hypothetical protein